MPDIMFPGGSPHLVEPIYKNPKLSAPFNEQLAEAVVARIRHLLPSLAPGQKVNRKLTPPPAAEPDAGKQSSKKTDSTQQYSECLQYQSCICRSLQYKTSVKQINKFCLQTVIGKKQP